MCLLRKTILCFFLFFNVIFRLFKGFRLCIVDTWWWNINFFSKRQNPYNESTVDITLKNREKTKLLFLTNTWEINNYKCSCVITMLLFISPKYEVDIRKE